MKTGKTPDISYIRPFGHVGFMAIHKEKRGKNNERAIKIRLMGYSTNGYWVEDQQGNHHYTRDVRWLQESTSMKLQEHLLSTQTLTLKTAMRMSQMSLSSKIAVQMKPLLEMIHNLINRFIQYLKMMQTPTTVTTLMTFLMQKSKKNSSVLM